MLGGHESDLDVKGERQRHSKSSTGGTSGSFGTHQKPLIQISSAATFVHKPRVHAIYRVFSVYFSSVCGSGLVSLAEIHIHVSNPTHRRYVMAQIFGARGGFDALAARNKLGPIPSRSSRSVRFPRCR